MRLPPGAEQVRVMSSPSAEPRRSQTMNGARCPTCYSESVERQAPAMWFEWLLLLVFLRPYRCKHCFRRFIRPFFWRSYSRVRNRWSRARRRR